MQARGGQARPLCQVSEEGDDMTTYARCPECGNLCGPLMNALLIHLRDLHGCSVDDYNVNTGQLRYMRSPVKTTIEFVEVADAQE